LIGSIEPGTTYLSPERLLTLERHLRTVHRRRIPGAVVECGVAAGGSAALMGLWLTRHQSDKPLVLFDTFDGLPAPTTNDPDYEKAIAWTGECRGTRSDVEAMFRRMGIDLTRVALVEGLFQDTIPAYMPSSIAMLHLDGDWYDSTRHCLEHLWPQVSIGGRVQIDDYGAWQGCRKATDEFLARHRRLRLHVIDATGVWLEKS
jgi:hypothetical protein